MSDVFIFMIIARIVIGAWTVIESWTATVDHCEVKINNSPKKVRKNRAVDRYDRGSL